MGIIVYFIHSSIPSNLKVYNIYKNALHIQWIKE